MSTSNCVPNPHLSVKSQIREFILESLARPKGISSFADGAPLMEMGVIDSLGVFRLVSFLEEHLGVRVDDQEINLDTLRSLDTIEALVIRKRGK
jgi:acyl carrier protein